MAREIPDRSRVVGLSILPNRPCWVTKPLVTEGMSSKGPFRQTWARYEDMGHRWAFRPPKSELVVFSQGVPTSPSSDMVQGRRCRERSASSPDSQFQTQALPSANVSGRWTNRKSRWRTGVPDRLSKSRSPAQDAFEDRSAPGYWGRGDEWVLSLAQAPSDTQIKSPDESRSSSIRLDEESRRTTTTPLVE